MRWCSRPTDRPTLRHRQKVSPAESPRCPPELIGGGCSRHWPARFSKHSVVLALLLERTSAWSDVLRAEPFDGLPVGVLVESDTQFKTPLVESAPNAVGPISEGGVDHNSQSCCCAATIEEELRRIPGLKFPLRDSLAERKPVGPKFLVELIPAQRTAGITDHAHSRFHADDANSLHSVCRRPFVLRRRAMFDCSSMIESPLSECVNASRSHDYREFFKLCAALLAFVASHLSSVKRCRLQFDGVAFDVGNDARCEIHEFVHFLNGNGH